MRTRPGVYDVQGLGYNYRMTDFQAALGVGQMDRYRDNLGARKLNGKRYTERLAAVDGVRYPEFRADNSYFLFQVVFDEGINRDTVLRKLREKGVGVSIHYATPVPLMSYYREKYACTDEEFPNAVQYGRQSLSLPVHGKITESDIDYICSTIQDIIQEK